MPIRESPLEARRSHPKPMMNLLEPARYKPSAYERTSRPLRMSPKLKSVELLPTPRSLKALCLQLNHGDMDIEESTRVKPIIGESRPHTLANLMMLIFF